MYLVIKLKIMIGNCRNIKIVGRLIYSKLSKKRKKLILSNNYGNNIFLFRMLHILGNHKLMLKCFRKFIVRIL
jgi:hypothetical protein